MTTTATPDTLRNTDLQALATRLQHDQARKLDLVVPAANLMANRAGQLIAVDAHQQLTPDGVTTVDLPIEIGRNMAGQVADKLKIPAAYYERMHTEATDLWAHNVNHWLNVKAEAGAKYLLRTFTAKPEDLDGQPAFGRALLSDRYFIVDHIDVLMTALDAVRGMGLDTKIVGCDLSESRMRVRVVCPEIQALAPALLAGYRSPFTGQTGTDNPVMFAGFEIGNGEGGGSRFTVTPRIEVQVCKNGLRIRKDALARTHVGAELEEGQVLWSDATKAKALELVMAQTQDIVRTCLNVEYMESIIRPVTEKGAVQVPDVVATVQRISKPLGWSPVDQAAILNHFTRGGVTTAAGLLHAATAYAQEIKDPEDAAAMEEAGMRALDLVAVR